MVAMNYEFDIFLGGRWEKHSPYPYKTIIKNAFPDKRIFDPETDPTQKNGKWFEKNFRSLQKSRTLVAFVPDFPFPGIGFETGVFYHSHCQGDASKPLEEIIIIWPDSVKPDHAKKIASKMGYVVENPDEAVLRLKLVLYSEK
ncbi:hypothetical protein JW756_03430 [Candidatus Woesearchaeota archaeon]|nr:hypothetical protein [Candidatus Woesearchaeota archaeon]